MRFRLVLSYVTDIHRRVLKNKGEIPKDNTVVLSNQPNTGQSEGQTAEDKKSCCRNVWFWNIRSIEMCWISGWTQQPTEDYQPKSTNMPPRAIETVHDLEEHSCSCAINLPMSISYRVVLYYFFLMLMMDSSHETNFKFIISSTNHDQRSLPSRNCGNILQHP